MINNYLMHAERVDQSCCLKAWIIVTLYSTITLKTNERNYPDRDYYF